MLTDVRSQSAEELQAQFEAWTQPAYRLNQLLHWLYTRRVTDWESMTNLPRALRDQLRDRYSIASLELLRLQGATDTTRKFLWRLRDHALIESVLIPANPALYGDASDRHTLCVSTQVGCAFGCRFCASGLDGWKRNLGVEEIVEQVLAVERREWETQVQSPESKVQSPRSAVPEPQPKAGQSTVHSPGSTVRSPQSRVHSPQSGVRGGEEESVPEGRVVGNLVVMGMGEPLANYDNLLKALRILNAPWGGNIGARKITVSTSGLAPQIRRLADEPLQLRLAVSLHGATDAVRGRIMPVNRKYPLGELAAAMEYYQEKKGRLITFEYILIAGVNDGLEQVKPLAALARRLHAKVNLIPYNRVEGLDWRRPDTAVQEAFCEALRVERVAVTLRREKGHEIDAACGQLRLRTEREIASGQRSDAESHPTRW